MTQPHELTGFTPWPDRAPYEAHCSLKGCGCDHINCYKGWIDNTAGTWPCLYCRENLTGRLMRADQARAKGYPQASISRILMDTTR